MRLGGLYIAMAVAAAAAIGWGLAGLLTRPAPVDYRPRTPPVTVVPDHRNALEAAADDERALDREQAAHQERMTAVDSWMIFHGYDFAGKQHIVPCFVAVYHESIATDCDWAHAWDKVNR